MLRTPDEEDLPLRHRPLPSVDIALLPHELRAARMQRLVLGGGAAVVILIVLALAFGPQVFAHLREAGEKGASEEPALATSESETGSASAAAVIPADQLEPALVGEARAPADPRSAQAAQVHATTTIIAKPSDAPLATGPLTRSEQKFGPAKSWREALVTGGASPTEANDIVLALQKLVDFRRGKPDDLLVFERDSDKALHAFEYRASLTEVYRATRSETGALRGLKVSIPIETRRIAKGTYVAGSLGHSISALALGPSLAGAVIEAFDTRVTFTRDTRAGDSVKLIVDEEYVDGTFLRYGPVQAVEYSGERAGKLQAFWFEPDKGHGEWFDGNGRAIHGGWLRTPLRYDHVSSPFNLKRRHPILKRIMPHHGIDYSAGTGTPVSAAADGVVTFAGARGANGNLVSLRHKNGYETHYAHLWRIAPGIRSGTKVKQRQSIGQVGTTGRSTGPHLHFALKRGGKFVDPTTQLNGPGDMLPSAQLPRFKADMQRLRAELERIPLAPAPSTETLPAAEDNAEVEDLDL